MFYPNNRKVIPPQVLTALSPLRITVWICDDGATGTKRYDLHTEGFTHIENQQLANWFFNRFLIRAKLRSRANGNWCPSFNRKESERIRAIIAPFVIPSMQYKVTFSDARNRPHSIIDKRTTHVRHPVSVGTKQRIMRKSYYKRRLETLEVYAAPKLIDPAKNGYKNNLDSAGPR